MCLYVCARVRGHATHTPMQSMLCMVHKRPLSTETYVTCVCVNADRGRCVRACSGGKHKHHRLSVPGAQMQSEKVSRGAQGLHRAM